MTQTAGERDQSRPAPWGLPAAGAQTAPLPPAAASPRVIDLDENTTAAARPAGQPVTQAESQPVTQPVAAQPWQGQPYQGQPYPGQPTAAGSYGYGSPSAAGASTGGQDPFGAPPTYPPAPGMRGGGTPAPHARRQPGWVALLVAASGSALLASLLTAGIVNGMDDGTPASSTTGTTASQQTAPVSSSSAENPNWSAVAAAVEKSVVSVQVSAAGGGGEGSGVILDKQGHVLTNNHVVAGAQEVLVVLSDGRGYKAEIVGTDPSTDIAVIKLTDPPSDLTPASLADSSAVKVGDPVMAIGNPLGLSDTVTTGIVSAVDRPVTTSTSEQQDPFAGGGSSAGEQVVTNAIQTDAAVNPGNSGGALVDAKGRVIGITSSIASLGSSGGQSGSIGLGFAIPINEVKGVAADLIESGTVEHAWMGVGLDEQYVSVDGALRLAAVITQISDGAPADEAGLQDGDAVIAIDGETVNGAESLIAQVRERRPDTKVTLTVVRDGETQDVSVTLGTRPAN